MLLNLVNKLLISSNNSSSYHRCYSSAKAMKKVLGFSKNRKHRYCENPSQLTPTTAIFNRTATEVKGSVNSRRASVLNKLFMEHITDLMATGTASSEFIGHGIEINKVKVTPDYSQVLVYWITKESQDDQKIDEILQRNAGALRHELSRLRVMGVVPRITFVKDKHFARVKELDIRLSRADFGDDYTPLCASERLKTELELETSLNIEEKELVKELESNTVEDEDEFSVPFPEIPMPQNTFNLNHQEIISRIKKAMKKSEALHRLSSSESNDGEVIEYEENKNPVTYADSRTEREAFKSFLKQRQILQAKLWREKNYTPDIEYIREELFERANNNKYGPGDNQFYEEDDYLIDDDDDGVGDRK